MADQVAERYLRKLQRLQRQPESTPELSLREPLLELLRAYGSEAGRHNLIIAPEASAGAVGQPDIYVKDGPRLIGFENDWPWSVERDRYMLLPPLPL